MRRSCPNALTAVSDILPNVPLQNPELLDLFSQDLSYNVKAQMGLFGVKTSPVCRKTALQASSTYGSFVELLRNRNGIPLEPGRETSENMQEDENEALQREREELLAALASLRSSVPASLPWGSEDAHSESDEEFSSGSSLRNEELEYSSSLSYFGEAPEKVSDSVNSGQDEGLGGESAKDEECSSVAASFFSLFDSMVRMSLKFLYLWLVSSLHFLVLPVSYVRFSRVNKLSRTDPNVRLTPTQEFFSPRGHVGLLPRPRVVICLVLGLILSSVVWVVTEDEFLFGPRAMTNTSSSETDFVVDKENMVLPVELSFDGVSCTVPFRDSLILQNISGRIPAKQITGILGPSGAGKSTFAWTLLGRGTRICRPQHGEIFLNGHRQSLNMILDRVGFVPQQDDFFDDLTVEETLLFSASWRLPWYFTEEDRASALEETLNLLDLEHIRKQRIGGLARRGISGGERKRVSIGIELIASPSVLVMDEPTSGLDSAAAFKLMHRLRTIADKKGVSIVVILHVPSVRVFSLLDNLILLQHGEAAFVGPRANATSAFKEMGFNVEEIIEGLQQTVPEFLLDVVAGGVEFPADLCPYEVAIAEKFGEVGASCDRKETLPMRWRRLVDEDDFFRYQGASNHGDKDQEDELCEKFGPILGRRCRNEYRRKQYPRVPKPGLFRQACVWFVVVSKFMIRRGVYLELICTLATAVFSAWVRSYSNSWDARAMAAFFVCITVTSLGSFAAVFQDHIGPVKRAADAGSVLGAHHNAYVCVNVLKSLITASLFSLLFHITLVVRTNNRVYLGFQRIVDMTILCFVGFCCSWSFGAFFCVVAQHSFHRAMVLVIGFLLWTHVFAMYSPNKRQIVHDSFLYNEKYEMKKLISLLCSMSPARYFIEAFTVWDSIPISDSPQSASGRSFMLNYFGYRDENLSGCLGTLFTFYLTMIIQRWLLFGYMNSTDFHSLYDRPLFAKFFAKLILSLGFSLAVLLTIHIESPGAVDALWTRWKAKPD